MSWRWSMRWSAVVGALIVALSGARAQADDQAAAPAAAPASAAAPAAAPATPAAPAAEAKPAEAAPAASATPNKPKTPEEAAAEAAAAAKSVMPGAAQPAVAQPAAAEPAVATPAAGGAVQVTPAAAGVDVPGASVGGSAPTTATGGPAAVAVAAASVEAKPEAEKPLYFNGLGMDFSLGDSTGLYAGDEAYQNVWSMFFAPSWKAGQRFFKGNPYLEKLSVSGRFILSGEFAGTGEQYRTGNVGPDSAFQGCASSAPGSVGGQVDPNNVPYCQNGSGRRADYSDITLKASDTVYTIPRALIEITPGLSTALPISAESRASGFVTSLQPSVNLSRNFFNKKLNVAYGVGYTKYFFSSNVPVYDSGSEPFQDPHNPQLSTNAVSSTGLEQFATGAGGFSPSFGFAHHLDVTYAPNEKLTFLGRYVIADTFKRNIPGCNVVLDGQPGLAQGGAATIDTCSSGAAVAAHSGAELSRGVSGSQQFWLVADYQILDYLGAEAALITAGPQRHPNGSWQQPFLTNDYKNYSTFNFSVTLTTESLAAKLLHKS